MDQETIRKRAEAVGYHVSPLDDGQGFNVYGFQGSDEQQERKMAGHVLLELVEIQEAEIPPVTWLDRLEDVIGWKLKR